MAIRPSVSRVNAINSSGREDFIYLQTAGVHKLYHR